MTFQKFFRISEERLPDGETTKNIDTFLDQLRNVVDDDGIISDISETIIKSRCPEIRFENLRGALGISKTDVCIINRSVLHHPIPDMIYIIMHEIAHQKQYTKHGEDIALGLYHIL